MEEEDKEEAHTDRQPRQHHKVQQAEQQAPQKKRRAEINSGTTNVYITFTKALTSTENNKEKPTIKNTKSITGLARLRPKRNFKNTL
jgi:beta-glucanase (GH16 family)